MGLAEYKRKRDFKKTAEPAGGKPLPQKVKGASRFVIQKHAARRLHYDFRLEMEGVLKSWALPKGLPWKRGEKHLAVEVEDHPIEYEDFEGIIPEGQYGGGTVMVWDRGNYRVYGEQPVKSLKEGKLHLVLDGDKAKGEWTLVRIRGRDDEKNQWLILKTGDDAKPIPKKIEDHSVKTGRTMEQIAEARDAEWESGRQADESPASQFKARIRAAMTGRELAGRGRRARQKITSEAGRERHGESSLPDLPSAKARFIEPMKAKLVEKPPATGDWIYELKFDGIRLIGIKRGEKVSLLSRNQNELAERFPEIVKAIETLPAGECVIDGEVVALDEEGRSSFQLLQAREMEGRKTPVYFYAFDLLQLDGKSLVSLPLEARKNVLEKLCADARAPIRYSGAIGGDAKRLLEEVERSRLGRDYRQTTQLCLRTRAQKRRMDQAQMCQRTGICYRRIHAAAGVSQIFRRDPRWLLREQEARFCRQGWYWLHCEIVVDVVQEISERSARRLPFCRSTIKAKWTMDSRHHALDDAQNALDKSGFRL